MMSKLSVSSGNSISHLSAIVNRFLLVKHIDLFSICHNAQDIHFAHIWDFWCGEKFDIKEKYGFGIKYSDKNSAKCTRNIC